MTPPDRSAATPRAGGALPRVSISILNHNYGRYLGEAIESCLRQQAGAYDLVDILVIDDGSTDDSIAVARSYGDAIRILERPHQGFGATLTAAIAHAHGDWVALLDADDAFTDDKLTRAALHLHGNVLTLRHWEHVVDAHGHPLEPRPHPGGNTSTLLVRRDAAQALLPVTNELFFHVLDDLGHGIRIREPLTRYRVHEASMTDRSTPGIFCDYMTDVCTSLATRLNQLAAAPPPWAAPQRLRRLARSYQAKAAAFALQAGLQRGHTQARWRLLARQLACTAAAGGGWSQVGASLRSALTARPLPAPAREAQ